MRTVLVVGLVVWSSASRAQPSGAQAEVLFKEGRELMTAGKLAEACSAFEASEKLEPAVTTLLNLAGCREKLGAIATAWGLFLDAERQTRSAADDASRQLHAIAQDRANKLEPRVSKLTIHISPDSQVAGLELSRDEIRVDAAMWNRALPIDGGTYTVTLHAPGIKAWSTTVTVTREGDSKSVEIPDVRRLPREPIRMTPIAPAVSASRSSLVPIVVGAGGLALGATALGFVLWGNATYRDAKAEMTDQTRRTSLYNSANLKRSIAAGTAVGGIAAIGVAVWLYVRSDRSTEQHAVRVVPNGSGLAVVGGF